MNLPKTAASAVLQRWLGRLRFPALFALTASVFVLDVLVPDLLPFVDEIVLGLATLALARWKRDRDERPTRARQGRNAPVIDVHPDAETGESRPDRH